jgi:hypothetical protein
MRFSERHGLKPVKLELQLDSMDQDLRNSLWSALASTLFDNDGSYPEASRRRIMAFCSAAYMNFFKLPVDSVPNYWFEAVAVIKEWYFKSKWYEVFDFLEFVAEYSERNGGANWRSEWLSLVALFLERERSGYRLVAGRFARITTDAELEAVNSAASKHGQFDGSAEHIRTAILHYSNRVSPDYRNAIKEAISAVEFTARVISGNNRAILSDAVRVIDRKHPIHPALKEGLTKLYAYTSDESGLRHALLEEGSNVDSTDALFMLVICSAFCNYLIERCQSEQ